MFKKINIPFYQNQWFGIKFLSLNTNKYLFKRANKNFYTNFYKEFKKKYKNINSLPSSYKKGKKQLADFLYENYCDKTILSYGSGIGVIELQLVKSSINITCHDSATNANFLVKDFLDYKDTLTEKYDVIYFSYVLYSMKKSEIIDTLKSLKNHLNYNGEIIVFFNERKKVDLRSILRIIKIILFGKGEFQFWGYERNSNFYVSLFKNSGFILNKEFCIANHRCLIYTKF